MVKWAGELEHGLDVEDVKLFQPDYLEIDWEDPEVIDGEKRYYITNIDWNWDALGMSNYLVFTDEGYVGRDSHK